MLKEFLDYNSKQKLFSFNNKIILAVSGGRDSVFMLEMFDKAAFDKNNLIIAHCNFHLRDDESNKDEKFVRKLAENKNIRLLVKHFNTKEYASENKQSIQMAARELRYNWFEQLRIELNFDKIAIAHNLNDSIETFFINLTRGTGLQGLTGIHATNNNIIRPVMFASRNNISEYLTNNNISWRDDSSNNSTKYLRNKIRLKILPLFEEASPGFFNKMNDNINLLQKTALTFNTLISSEIDKIVHNKSNFTEINTNLLKQKEFPEIYLFEILKNYDFTPKQIEEINKLIFAESGKFVESQNFIISKNRNNLILTKKEQTQNSYTINSIDDFKNLPVKFSYKTGNKIPEKFSDNKSLALLDLEKLSFPLILRKWQQGDKFKPLGMNNFQKISDFFNNNKFSSFDKQNTWLLCTSKNEIVWIVNHRIDNRFKITGNTKKVLNLQFENTQTND